MLRLLRSALVRRTDRALRTFYYRTLYGRALPGPLTNAIARWERARPRGDLPQSAAVWDQQYGDGRWDYLANPGERARFAVIVGLLTVTPDPAVLDVGCGDGVLYRRMRPYGCARFVGVDMSRVAVEKAAATAGPEAQFVAADASAYRPEGLFDAIVFNEMLYYLHEPIAEVRRYAGALAPGGRLIVSTWGGSPRGAAILRQLRRSFGLIEEVGVEQGPHRWTLSVFLPN